MVAGLATTPHRDARQDHTGSGHRRGEQSAEPVNATGSTQPVTSTHAPQPLPARAEPVAAAQVTGQVFPEVARLVSRGDGTQRITLKLSPEALGDVRVILTVRDGDVHVRMIGSEQAQQALRAGAPELHRLLDLAGAGSSQVVVGDHSSSDAGLPSGADDRHTAHDTEDHRTAGTRDGDTTARDGYPGAQQPRRSTEPTATSGAVTSTLAGVDVTI
jgi:flagellar hook-length control protein FliK